MRVVRSAVVAAFVVVGIAGCVAPRLGESTIRYDNSTRTATPREVFVPIYETRADVPYPFLVIGEVQAAPKRAERAFGYDPIEVMKQQARAIGGVALLEVRSGEGEESRHVWKAKVVARK